ncbi:MAG: cyclic pyranopterin monophosphate synthase MoaC [Planctomycetota bacterium]
MAELTHLDGAGTARMVDVTAKPATDRTATAEGLVRLAPATGNLIRSGDVPKGDVLTVARVAGIGAAKRTGELIPLCHPLPLTHVDVGFEWAGDDLRITATARTTAPTGVEMEALTAVSVAALTVYDMVKSADRTARIDGLRLLQKTGGKSGPWSADSR